MKKTLFGMAIAIAATSAFAHTESDPLFGSAPAAPHIYSDNLTRSQLPTLFKTDRGAFTLLEALQQVGETYVQVNGCPTKLKGTVDLFVGADGTGDVVLTTSGSSLRLDTSETADDKFRGNKYEVVGKSGTINGLAVNDFDGDFTYNALGTIMTGKANMFVPTADPSSPDRFSSVVIKDFYKEQLAINEELRDFTLDWGLQVVSKKGYPVSKWWQTSHSVHDDGIEGRTKFQKIRIAGGSSCKIVINTHGLDNSEIFWQKGSFKIVPVSPAS